MLEDLKTIRVWSGYDLLSAEVIHMYGSWFDGVAGSHQAGSRWSSEVLDVAAGDAAPGE